MIPEEPWPRLRLGTVLRYSFIRHVEEIQEALMAEIFFRYFGIYLLFRFFLNDRSSPYTWGKRGSG
jgi:hypothetical protein